MQYYMFFDYKLLINNNIWIYWYSIW